MCIIKRWGLIELVDGLNMENSKGLGWSKWCNKKMMNEEIENVKLSMENMKVKVKVKVKVEVWGVWYDDWPSVH